jgi:hypothetical protein
MYSLALVPPRMVQGEPGNAAARNRVMASRPIWSGFVQFSLVSMPVKAYSATRSPRRSGRWAPRRGSGRSYGTECGCDIPRGVGSARSCRHHRSGDPVHFASVTLAMNSSAQIATTNVLMATVIACGL